MLVLTQKCLKSPVNYLTLHLYPHKSSNEIQQTSCLLSAVGSASVSRNRADMREDYPNLQPRYVPWLGIKPPAFCCTGRHSNQLGHPARARTLHKIMQQECSGKSCQCLRWPGAELREVGVKRCNASSFFWTLFLVLSAMGISATDC